MDCIVTIEFQSQIGRAPIRTRLMFSKEAYCEYQAFCRVRHYDESCEVSFLLWRSQLLQVYYEGRTLALRELNAANESLPQQGSD